MNVILTLPMNTLNPLPYSGLPVIMVGTTDKPAEVPSKTASLFVHRVEMDAPRLEEREAMIEGLSQGANVARGEEKGKGVEGLRVWETRRLR